MSGQARAPRTLRLARPDEGPDIVAFLDENWGEKHPLVHIPEFFDFYYRPFGPDGPLQFAVAEQDGRITAAAGYVRANRLAAPDIWVSIWCAARDKAYSGSGLELLDALRGLTGARLAACNNIRPRVAPLYRFAGYDAGRLPHYYRLTDRAAYRVARVAEKKILPVSGDAALRALPTEDDLRASGYAPDKNRRPYKDLWYLTRRYYYYPHQRYDVWGVEENGAGSPVTALLVTRRVPVNGTAVLRVVDYTGAPDAFPRLGAAVDRLMAESGAEYADCYCLGIPPGTMAAAGFCERAADEANILPNYLTPPLYENTEYYYAAWDADSFTMFKADGDQDRPNLSVP